MKSDAMNGGLFYLSNNDIGMDEFLINRDYLINAINKIKNDNQNKISNLIATKLNDVDILKNSLINSTLSTNDQTAVNLQITKLNTQIQSLQNRSVSPTIEDIKKTHALFIESMYKPIVSVGYWYSKYSNNTQPLLGSKIRVSVPLYGNFVADMILSIKLSSFSAVNNNNKVRYCNFPGHRICKSISYSSNNNLIDTYTTEDINFYYDLYVPNSQKPGWNRCVGQDNPKKAFLTQDPLNQEVREEKLIYDGYQTFKHTQPELEILLPLQFWFCDPKYALSTNNMGINTSYIEADLATVDLLTNLADYASDNSSYSFPKITEFSLYTNHIFITPEVASLFITINAFSIIKIHQTIQQILTKKNDAVLLKDLKFAVESLAISFRPIDNTINENHMETWNNNNIIEYTEIAYPSILTRAGIKTLGYTNAYYYAESNVLDSLSLISNGSTLYDAYTSKFYDSYIPFRYGKNTLITPHTTGSHFIPFNLFANKNQPSGYLNFSNARESFLNYESSFISTANPTYLNISAKTIQFVLLDKEGISVRFAT